MSKYIYIYIWYSREKVFTVICFTRMILQLNWLHLQNKIKTLMLIIGCCPYGQILTQSL